MPETPQILQLKIRLLGISPMIWRWVLIPSTTTLRELHGIIQVAMGWESIHLYQFDIRAVHYWSFELFAANPDVPLSGFAFRQNETFLYVYDMGDHWEHEVRIEAISDAAPKNLIRPASAALGPAHQKTAAVRGAILIVGMKLTVMTPGRIWASWLVFSKTLWLRTPQTDQYLTS